MMNFYLYWRACPNSFEEGSEHFEEHLENKVWQDEDSIEAVHHAEVHVGPQWYGCLV